MNSLIRKRPYKMLMAVTKQTGTQGINTLGKGIYATYKSRYETLVEFEGMDFVRFEKLGREVIVWLTPDGQKAVDYLNFLIRQPKRL